MIYKTLASSMGTNRLLLLLSVTAITIASLAYCFAPRLGVSALNEGGPIATVALQPAATDHAPALDIYRDALECLSAGDDATARRLLAQGREQEIVITRLSSVNTPAGEMSGASVMMELSGRICDRALAAAGDGDRAGALGWIRQAHLLVEHILGTNAPTLDALQAGRAIDQKTGRTVITILRRVGTTAEAERAARGETALNRFYSARIMPYIREAMADHTTAMQKELLIAAGGRRPRDGASPSQAADRRDEARAENLIALYARERKRGGEPK
jgi:hypothetical protein